ncbi:MAG: circadian clock KaiB family protein [Deltaproteobacteria bacterium]|jgi:circadian clock protein KaiB|nr:circadian clock KaiB family protein [Deltaproteobacteria bacterium]
MEEKVLLKLFVAGKTSRSKQAVEGIAAAFDAFLKERGTLDIIDVLKQPQQAMEEQVLATPTLIRLLPTPVRRVIGDLSDGEKAFDLLELLDEKR